VSGQGLKVCCLQLLAGCKLSLWLVDLRLELLLLLLALCTVILVGGGREGISRIYNRKPRLSPLPVAALAPAIRP
jgi:hypothetical protein